MIKNETLKKILPSSILLNPIGKNGNEIWIEDFEQLYPLFFKSVLEIQKADISEFSGFGEFTEDGKPEFSTFQDFLVKSFDDSNDDYWKNWKELFNTSMMKKEFFEKYFNKMIELGSFCQNQRFLVNNNLFFGNMIIMKDSVGFIDWNRAAITDWILDFATMDLHRPYFKIPEKLVPFFKQNGIEVPNFKERFLCMAYYKGLNALRWHASIDDETSCKTIIASISELEDRINSL